MESNRSKFESHGYLISSIAEKLEIQISQSGKAARYQSTIRWSSRGMEVIHGRWQETLTNFICNDYGTERF